MLLDFLNRDEERSRLKLILAEGQSFAAVYGRRRCGKSRLLKEVIHKCTAVFYVGDQREALLQMESLAHEVSKLIPGFDEVKYNGWEGLLNRWWREAPPLSCLCMDEFPYLVQGSPELPSLLQKLLDGSDESSPSLILCGSSQTMMHGLVLDATAPLYGRAKEILRIKPLSASYLPQALNIRSGTKALEAYTMWGGIPRYWELAKDHASNWEAYEYLVLNPLGALYAESERLLQEDIRDPAQSISILSLIGTGSHRPSEIASRLGKPISSLSRPISKLMDLQLINKEVPFGAMEKHQKFVHYTIADPFMALWYQEVLPYRSSLEIGMGKQVSSLMQEGFLNRMAATWESLVRESLPTLHGLNGIFLPAQRWWGNDLDRQQMELDVVAESIDKKTLLVGEVKLTIKGGEVNRLLNELERKSKRLPFYGDYDKIEIVLFSAKPLKQKHKSVFDSLDVFKIRSTTSS